jgi:hypothetical protein
MFQGIVFIPFSRVKFKEDGPIQCPELCEGFGRCSQFCCVVQVDKGGR